MQILLTLLTINVAIFGYIICVYLSLILRCLRRIETEDYDLEEQLKIQGRPVGGHAIEMLDELPEYDPSKNTLGSWGL